MSGVDGMSDVDELFLEDLRDTVIEILKDSSIYTGEEIYLDRPKNWSPHIWSVLDLPKEGETDILDKDGNIVGRVKWETVIEIIDYGSQRGLTAYPEITYLEYKGQVLKDGRDMELVVTEDDELFIEGERVEKIKTIGYGPQYTVILGKANSSYYLIEVGISTTGQYVEILAQLNEIEV